MKKKAGKKKLPFDLTAPISSRKQYLRERGAATRTEFRPLERQLGSEHRAQSDREQRITPAYFEQYKADLAKAQGQSQAAYQQADSRLLAHGQAAGAQDAASRNDIQTRMAADIARRGGVAGPAQGVDVGGAGAEAARANLRTSMAGSLAQQGANNSDYLGKRQANTTLQGIEQQQKEGLRRRGIEADQRELAKQKGDFKYQFGRDMRESERKYLLEGRALNDSMTKAQIAAATSRKNNKRTTSTSASNAALSQAGQNARQEDKQKFDKKQAKKDRKGKSKGKL